MTELARLRSGVLRLLTGALLVLASLPAAADEVEVEVVGIEGELAENVRSTLSIATIEEGVEPSPDRIRRLHARAEKEIRTALEPFGYYRPRVEGDLERVSEGTWRAIYEVDQGPPLRLSSVHVEVTGPGSDEPAFRGVVSDFPLREGDRLRHRPYESSKDQLEEVAAERGYLDATFTTSEIRVDLETYEATIDLVYDTGPRYLFGPVRFEQSVLEPDLLRGYVTFEPGEPIDLDEILRLQAALSDSPYFARVEVTMRTDEVEERRVPIVVELVPAKRQRWEIGAGYGTDTGPRGTLGLDLRRINRQGHRGEVEVRISEIESRGRATYAIPGPYPRTDLITFSLGYAEQHTETSESTSRLASVGRSVSRGRWREALAMTYREEDFEVGLDEGRSELLFPEASWRWVRADDRIYPEHGERLTIVVSAADESLVSDATFFQATLSGKVVRTLVEDVRLLTRAEVGRLETDDFRRLPPSVRYFAGGDESVRGYDYESLGVRDAEGNVIGGTALVTASVEIDWLFYERWGRWGLATFFDAGDATRELTLDLEQGVGVGVRWLSPVGMVRADVARALDREGEPFRFHLSLGPEL